jgi:hypothetical protein
MLRPMRSFAIVLALSACGGSVQLDGPDIRDARTADDQVPASDRDPLPYTPVPRAANASTDETVALAASGGEDQARQLLPILIRAIRDADERQLDQLFADDIVQGQSEPRPRSVLVQRVLIYARRQIIAADTPVEELVDIPNVQVARAGQFWQGRSPPPGVRPNDIVVEVPLLEAGRLPLRTTLGWQLRGYLVVRPGRDPRIVAL